MMSGDTERPVSVSVPVMTDDSDDVSKDGRLAVSTVDSATSQRWTTPAAAAAAAVAAGAAHDDSDHHECANKRSVDEFRVVQQHASVCPTAPPPIYGRLPGSEFDVGYDYSYSPQYSSRYTPFQAPSAPSYVGAMTPYAAPYSPAGLGAYTFNLAGPCPTGATSYVPHHLTPPSAALLTPERSAPGYRFTASSTSLLQPRMFTEALSVLQLACSFTVTNRHSWNVRRLCVKPSQKTISDRQRHISAIKHY